MNYKKIIMILASTLLVSACGQQKNETLDSEDSIEAVVESGVTSISGVLDDQNGSSFAMNKTLEIDPVRMIQQLIIPTAYAENCSRAVAQACNIGVKQANYSNCGTVFDLNGSVTLTYSDMGCSMANVGDSVVRTYDYTIEGPRGGILTNSSLIKATYDGTQLSGGARLERAASGWLLNISGKHKSLSRNDREIFDISIETPTQLEVSGGLSRASRQVNNGSLKVYHNLAEFSAEFSANNLQWNASCCHPVSGSLSVNYSGSVTGSATVTFNGCGTATHEKDGLSQDITLSYCE